MRHTTQSGHATRAYRSGPAQGTKQPGTSVPRLWRRALSRNACAALLATVVGAAAAESALAQAQITRFEATVLGTTITYAASACGPGELRLYYDLPATPSDATPSDATERVGASCAGGEPGFQNVSFARRDVSLGFFRGWVGLAPDAPTEAFVARGPVEVCVGPDLRVGSFSVRAEGALVTYLARVCNDGSRGAGKFRVGVWRDRATRPTGNDMGDLFISFKDGVAAGACADGEVAAPAEPNGDYSAWAVADSGEGGAGFIPECREGPEQAFGPVRFSLRNPDLVVERFDAQVRGTDLTYVIQICNKGAAEAVGFFVDVFFDRPRDGPKPFEPGDVARRLGGLAPQQCTVVQIPRGRVPEGEYTAYCIVDADDFVSEPDEGNNLGGPLVVRVGASALVGADGCVDADGDGFGWGPACVGVPDCDDTNPDIYPGAEEICGDGIDNDCDLTVDDGCPGVDCVDKDGDGWGVGADCVLQDYDDDDPEVYPWSSHALDESRASCVDNDGDGWGVGPGCRGPQDCDDNDPQRHPGIRSDLCGDGIDNDCDGTIDDGCEGVDCVDKDGDGWGVGADCAMPDPDDTNPGIYPYSDCVDRDGDGFGVGSDCKGPPDCDDSDPKIHPGAEEICGDGIDNDCDLTVDDGCPWVDCVDHDGDGIGVGPDCVVADCDDTDPLIAPWVDERCGDNKDDNCNGIADDGCWGRQCVDRDGDGFGVGIGCPGPQDCDDNDFAIKPGAEEVCGDGIDNDCDGTPDDGCNTRVDRDGDGAEVGGAAVGVPDCNDSDPAIHPGAVEVCGDGIDNDCDGTVDDGCPGVDCIDRDGDGWGSGPDCVIPDCNDDDPSIHPWATEVCDGVDNDCDTTIDEGCPGVDCVDADLDGWGVGPGCGPRQDCDDEDGGASPWRTEICGDDKDNDCDRLVDEGCLSCEDKDGDGHGVGPKCSSWDCNDNNPTVYPGAPEICDLLDNNCDGVVPPGELECALAPGCGSCRLGTGAAEVGVVYLFGALLWAARRRRRRPRSIRTSGQRIG